MGKPRIFHRLFVANRGEVAARIARACDTLDDLLDVAWTFNNTFVPPLPDAQVVRTARSAWRYEAEDLNWLGGPARAVFTDHDINRTVPAQDPCSRP